jgi:acyl-CoA thioester hydrolase
MYGHVNNVVYGQWIDTIVNNYLIENCSFNPLKSSSIGFVVSSYCNYYSPISYPSIVDVGLFVSRIGNSSVDYTVGIFENKESLKASSVGGFTHVFFDRINNRPKPLDDLFRNKLVEISNKKI